MLIRGVGMACCYRQATRFAPPRARQACSGCKVQWISCLETGKINCVAFFSGTLGRPGAFVVADMCVNLLVELAFGAGSVSWSSLALGRV